MTPGPGTGVGERPHRVTLQNPGPTVPNPDGGFDVPSWIDCAPPHVQAKIEAATPATLERFAASTVVTSASHLVTILFHQQVTERTRVLFSGRIFSVTGVFDPDERHVELVLATEEVK